MAPNQGPPPTPNPPNTQGTAPGGFNGQMPAAVSTSLGFLSPEMQAQVMQQYGITPGTDGAGGTGIIDGPGGMMQGGPQGSPQGQSPFANPPNPNEFATPEAYNQAYAVWQQQANASLLNNAGIGATPPQYGAQQIGPAPTMPTPDTVVAPTFSAAQVGTTQMSAPGSVSAPTTSAPNVGAAPTITPPVLSDYAQLGAPMEILASTWQAPEIVTPDFQPPQDLVNNFFNASEITARRQYETELEQLRAQLAMNGMSGSGAALAAERQLGERYADDLNAAKSNAYSQAAVMYVNTQMDVMKSNQAARVQSLASNQQAIMQAQQLNQQATLQTGMTNANMQMQADTLNINAALTAMTINAQLEHETNALQAQLEWASSQTNAELGMQAGIANQNAQLQTNAQNAQLAQSANLANAQMQTAAMQANAAMQMNASQINAQNQLATNQMNMDAWVQVESTNAQLNMAAQQLTQQANTQFQNAALSYLQIQQGDTALMQQYELTQLGILMPYLSSYFDWIAGGGEFSTTNQSSQST